jgi:hypothetical protein
MYISADINIPRQGAEINPDALPYPCEQSGGKVLAGLTLKAEIEEDSGK